MRHPILLSATALALSACQPSAPDPRGVDRDETLLTVSATGDSETAPDEARFTLGVTTQAGSAREASRLNAEKMEKVMAALKALGATDKDMQTSSLNLGRIDYGKERGQYRASNTLTVRFRQMDKVGEAITASAEAGANVQSGPNLVVTDREKATRSAYAAAYKAARERADAYAEAAGLEVSRVLTIRDGGGYHGPTPVYEMDARMESVQTAAPPPPINAAPFQPGMNQSRVSVSVAFALKEK